MVIPGAPVDSYILDKSMDMVAESEEDLSNVKQLVSSDFVDDNTLL